MSYEVKGIKVEELELEEIELSAESFAPRSSYDETLREGFALLTGGETDAAESEEALPPAVDTGVLEDFGL